MRSESADVATAVLIIACPCALTLAAPIALGTGMGVLGRAGCYLRQPGVLLDLARVTLIDVRQDRHADRRLRPASGLPG